jgi:hypothetical protein
MSRETCIARSENKKYIQNVDWEIEIKKNYFGELGGGPRILKFFMQNYTELLQDKV